MSANNVSPAAQAVPAAVPKRRRWLRRLFVVLLLLLLLVRLALPWLVSPALNLALKPYGLEATIDDLDLGLLGGRLALRDVSVRERSPHATQAGRLADPAEEFLRLHLLTFDWDMTALLTGRVRAHELQLDGLDMHLERGATGSWNVERYLAQAAAANPRAEADPKQKEKVALSADADEPSGQPIQLGLPLEITLLRAQRLELQIRDSANGAAEARRLALDLSINDLGSKVRPAHLSANLAADRGLDRLHLDLRGTSAGPEADLAADFSLAGLDLKQFATWLAPLGLELEAAQPWSARGGLKGQIRAAREDQSECRAELELAPLRLSAGGQPVAGLERLSVDVPALFGPRLEIRSVELGGLFARAGLDPAGNLEIGGLVLVPRADAGADQSAEPEPETKVQTDGAQGSVALGEFLLEGARFEFLDRSQTQPAELAFLLNSLRVNSLEFGGTSSPGPRFSPLSLEASAPGLWERLTLTGQLELAETLGLDLTLALNGLQPLAVEPYLKALGWRSNFAAGSLDARLVGSFKPQNNGGFQAQLALEGLRLQDLAQPTAENPSIAPTEHLRLDRLALEGVAQSPNGALLVERLRLEGLVASAEREADGTLRLLGLQSLLPETAKTPAADAPVASADQPAPNPQPLPNAAEAAKAPARVQINAVDFSGIELAFEDRASPGSPRLATAPLSLTARDIGLFGGEASTGQVEVELGLRGLFERLNLSAQLSPGSLPEAIALAGQFALTGLDYQALEPLLLEAGIARFGDPAQAAGAFEATATPSEGAWQLAAKLSQWNFSSGPVEWARLESLDWQAARFGPAGTELGRMRLSGLTLQAERDADGGLLAFGLRIAPPPAPAEGALEAAPAASAPSSPDPEAGSAAPTDSAPATAAAPLGLESLELADVQLRWHDGALADPLDLGLRLNGAISGYSNQASAAPAGFGFELGLEPAAGQLRLSGTLAATPAALALTALMEGSALELSPLEPYFPPGMSSEFSDGRLGFRLGAQMRQELQGQSFGLEVQDFVFAPQGAQPAAVAFESLNLDGSMGSDPAAPSYALGLDWRGLELRARRSSEGTLHVLGLALAPASGSPPETPVEAIPAAEAAPGAESPDASAAVPPAALEPQLADSQAASSGATPIQVDAPLPISNNAPLVAAARRVIPRVDLLRFELDLTRFEFLDEAAVDTGPLLANLNLRTPGPLRLLDPEPERIQPVALELRAAVEPGLRQLTVKFSSEPFDLDPWAELQLAFEGLDARELASRLPSAFEGLDPAALSDANFTLNLRSEIDLPRREATDFDLRAGLSANLTAENLALRGVTDGPPLIGLEKLVIEGLRYLPATGAIDVRSVELSKPAGRIKIKPEGLELAGLTFLSQPAEAAAAEQKAEPESASPEAPAVADGSTAGTPAVANASAPSAEVSIGQLLISGLDFELEDQTVERPLVLPFNQLEVDVRGLTTRALKEPLPVRFNLFLGAGQVELRKRERASSLLAGMVGAAGRVVTGGSDEAQYEMRSLMQEISAVGRLTLVPKPEGLVRIDIAGLELPAFYGLAKRSGVEIDDGVLDLKLRAELQGEKGLELETRTVFTDLSLSEPADGPIARYLKLPAPLDSVVYLLKNQNGELSLPLSVDVPADGLGGAAIASAAVTTLGTVIAKAVTSSPLRVTGALTGLLGIGGGADEPELFAAQDVGFAAGWGELTAEGRAELSALAASLRKDKQLRAILTHEFGSADWARAAALANPPRAEAEALAHQLRQRRDVLEQRREAAAADARGAVLLGTDEAVARARALLLELDLERQAAEAALDRLYALLRPGAESRAEARTREAALAVAGSRLDAVYAELLSLGVPQPAERLEFRPPRASSESGGEQGRVHIELRRVK